MRSPDDNATVTEIRANASNPPAQVDALPRLRQAIDALPDGGTLRLRPQVYHLYPDSAEIVFLALSNNRAGRKHVAFHLRERKNLTVDGNGARFVVHGSMLPFAIVASRNITLHDLTIDWDRPFYSQGEILDANSSHMDIRIDPGIYPYAIVEEKLRFKGLDWENPLTEGIFEVEPETGRPAPGSGDNLGGNLSSITRVRQLRRDLVRIECALARRSHLGNHLILRHAHRDFPAVFSENSQDLVLENLCIRHAAGTAILAQFCENVMLRTCQVRPDLDSGRLFSSTADATHFVNCRGLIHLEGCSFANQLDDAVNIHGIHYPVAETSGPRSLRVARGHFQQKGVPCGFPGDTIHFRDCDSLLPYGSRNQIHSVEVIDDQFLKIDLTSDHRLDNRGRFAMENLTWTPEIRIENCDFRNNRARGILVSSPKKTEIIGNRISPAGAGIKISGDAKYWFEAGSVHNVRIINNTFGDGNYGPKAWGRAAIDIDPEIDNPWKSGECFHRNIFISENTFASSHAGILYARSVEGLVFRDNRIAGGSPIDRPHSMECRLTLDACRNYQIGENHIAKNAPTAEMTEINDQLNHRHTVVSQPHLEDPHAII